MREIAEFHKLLSDEARLRILWLLFHRRELCVCEITAALGITQSKASRHLAALRAGGLVRDRRAGTWAYYALHRPAEPGQRAALAALKAQLAAHPEAAALKASLESSCAGGVPAACEPLPARAARRPTTTRPAAGKAKA